MKKTSIISLVVLLLSCAGSEKKGRPVAIENNKFIEKDGKQWLYGGEEERMHFDITDYALKDEQFHYGIGREQFPALLEPEFYSVTEAASIWPDSARFLLALGNTETKAYAVKDLTRHEVVNDRLDGFPIMAAYCVLADLGAIYERKYANKEFTFALSGYTYYDPEVWNGLDGFILWDRETESLWWPLTGKAVSGKMKGVKLLELDKQYWKDTTWGDIKTNHLDAKVMKSGLDYERPKSWPKYEDVSDVVQVYGEK